MFNLEADLNIQLDVCRRMVCVCLVSCGSSLLQERPVSSFLQKSQTLPVLFAAEERADKNVWKNQLLFHNDPTCLLSLLLVYQTLDGGQNVIQLETAVGAAIKCFDNALGINVPRSRFLPVKTTSDLLLVMSNLYSLDAGSLTMSPKREFPTTPHVKLGSSFTKVFIKKHKELGSRFSVAASLPPFIVCFHCEVSKLPHFPLNPTDFPFGPILWHSDFVMAVIWNWGKYFHDAKLLNFSGLKS